MRFMSSNLREARLAPCRKGHRARVGEKATRGHGRFASAAPSVSQVLRQEKKGLTQEAAIRLLVC
jgi:hypothetical protein